MATYSVEIVPKAEKEYLKLPQSVKSRFQEIILSLERDPRPFGSKKLRETDYYRLVAVTTEWFTASTTNQGSSILSIGHRKEIYRSF